MVDEASAPSSAGPVALSRRGALASLGGLLVAGCATLEPHATPAGLGPRVPGDSAVFKSFDGAELPMSVWATDGRPRGVVVALHGFDDYARAFEIAGPFWARFGVMTYAVDQRGFGRAPGRGAWPGDEALIEDLRALCEEVRGRHPDTPVGVVGESMGGAVAIRAFASDRPPAADRLVLLSPAVWGWRDQPLVNKIGLKILDALAPGLALQPPGFIADQHKVCDDERILTQMDQDPNIINATRVDATVGLIDLMEKAAVEIARLRTPTLYLYGANDKLIPKAAAFAAASRLGRAGRTAYYKDGWHLLDRDRQAHVALADSAAFLLDPKTPLPSGAPEIPRLA